MGDVTGKKTASALQDMEREATRVMEDLRQMQAETDARLADQLASMQEMLNSSLRPLDNLNFDLRGSSLPSLGGPPMPGT